jgi:hypothetical protein
MEGPARAVTPDTPGTLRTIMPRPKPQVEQAKREELRERHNRKTIAARQQLDQRKGQASEQQQQQQHVAQQPLPQLRIYTSATTPNHGLGHGRITSPFANVFTQTPSSANLFTQTPSSANLFTQPLSQAIDQVMSTPLGDGPSHGLYSQVNATVPSDVEDVPRPGATEEVAAGPFIPPNMNVFFECIDPIERWHKMPVCIGFDEERTRVMEAWVVMLRLPIKPLAPGAPRMSKKCTLGFVEVVGTIDLQVRMVGEGNPTVMLNNIYVVRSKAEMPRIAIFIHADEASKINRRTKAQRGGRGNDSVAESGLASEYLARNLHA